MTENRRKAEDKLRGFGGVCKNTAIGCGIKRAGQMASGKRAGRKQDAGAGRKPGMRLGMLCLTASLSVSLPMTAWASPEFAYSTEKWASLRDNVMEYEELADLIHEYNATIINNRLEYDEYRGKSNDDLKNAYQDVADHLYDASDKMMDTTDEDQPGYGSVAANAALSRVQAEQNQDTADAMNEDGYVKKLEYDRQEAVLVKDAQTKMISYWQKAKARPALEEDVNQARSKYEAMAVKAGQGMATQAELLGAREKMEAAQAALETNDRERDGLRRELCVMTGWDHNAQPDIREVPVPDAGEMDQIDLEFDKERAIEQNFTQTANERRLTFTGNGTQWDVMNQKVETGRRQIEADVEAKYKLLKQAQADYDQTRGELELAVRNAQAAERRYSLGTISRNEYLQQRDGLASKQSSNDVAGLRFRQAMEDYRWAVNGLAQTEGA